MSTTSKVSLKAIYTDYSERIYKITNNTEASAEGIAAIKTAVHNFNTAAQNNEAAIVQTFISEEGAPIARITDVDLITTTEEVIYNG